MSKLEAKELVPELRFSEFRESEGWSQKKIKDIFSIFQGYAFSSTDGVSTGVRWLKIADVDILKMNHNSPSFLPKPYEKEYGRFVVKKDDYVMALTRPILGGKLKIAPVDDVFDGALLNQRVGKLVTEGNSTFIYYLIQTSQLVSDMEKNIAGSEPPNLSSQQIKDIKTCIPSDEREQQKIADCLSSMDDLIAASTQKLESLKSYKKGLMQKLFPAEGKSVPELRFSGFDSEWVEVELNELGCLVSGLTYAPEDVQDSGLLVLRSSNVQNGQICYEDSVFVSPNIKGANLSKPNDILICVRNGSKALIGKNALIPSNIPLSTHGAFMTIFRSEQAKFVFQLFQTFTYKKQVEADLGATINSINGKQFLKYKFVVPQDNNEKNQIVDFLSSIDDLIKAQFDKIETLKAHKKGLMQRLFPVVKGLAS